MRPDEHKKKKNAAYKKKHGIENKPSTEISDKGFNKEKVVSKKKSNDKSGQLDLDRKTLQQQPNDRAQSQAQAQAQASSDEKSSDSAETDQKPYRRKQFSRREIVSNWQKYELEPEADDKITVRGEKYETLLSMAGEAMSRFRFRDELEWEDEQGGRESESSKEEFQSCVLNPSDLWQSLSCIPIHQLLNVDESLFPKDQLDFIQQTASKNRELYCAKNTQEIVDAKNKHPHPSLHNQADLNLNRDSGFSKKESDNKNKHNDNTITKVVRTSNSSNLKSTSALPSSNDFERGKKPKEHETERKSESIPSRSVQSQALALQDHDLDRLLDLSVELDSKDGETVVDASQISSSSAVSDRDSSKDKYSENVSKEEKNGTESENLEEWLDSILD